MPTPNEHALLSASSASRWLYCTRAPRLEEAFPESTSKYAEAGRVAHAIAELKARKYFLESMPTRSFNAQMKKFRADPHYEKSAETATDVYLDYLKSIALGCGENSPFVALESQVDYSRYAPEGFGTADCIMINPPTLYVVDYKNGTGIAVAAEKNPQMMLYALGALEAYAPIYGESIKKVSLAIVQPNAGGVKEWSISRGELETWGEDVVNPAAELAYAGEGVFAASEERCHFCRAKATCTARSEMYLGLETYEKKRPPLLTDEEVGNILERAAGLASWASDLKDYALSAILEGKAIPGFKAVEGRSIREWDGGADAAFDKLKERGVEEALLWERRPVTPPALEKALGKKPFEAVADLVVKKSGKPTLAPETDSRKPYNAAEIAFDKVEEVTRGRRCHFERDSNDPRGIVSGRDRPVHPGNASNF